LQKALRIAYPSQKWNFPATSKGQQYLKEALENLFTSQPQHNSEELIVLENYKHPDLLHTTSRKAELDLFIPSLKLAFEYQGEQHERQIHRGDFKRQLERDEEKKKLCELHGITLICVPYRWSGLVEDLVATIHYYRPELSLRSSKIGTVISPTNFHTQRKEKTERKPTNFMLPTVYQPVMDPTNWSGLNGRVDQHTLGGFQRSSMDFGSCGWGSIL
jgi:hypothetical protein